MSKAISLKKNTIANYLGQFYNMFIGIFMLPFYSKYLGAEAYGLVGFFTMFTSIMMLLDMGFSQALTRETAKLKDKINGFKNHVWVNIYGIVINLKIIKERN